MEQSRLTDDQQVKMLRDADATSVAAMAKTDGVPFEMIKG